jgi:hypothetical protein
VVEVTLKVVSCLSLSCLLLAACAGGSNFRDRVAKDAGSGRTEMVDEGTATALAGEGDMVIEEAFLRTGVGGDEIVVRARGATPATSRPAT